MNYLWKFIKDNRTFLSIIFLAPCLAIFILLAYSLVSGEVHNEPMDWVKAQLAAYGVMLAAAIDNLRNEKEDKNTGQVDQNGWKTIKPSPTRLLVTITYLS